MNSETKIALRDAVLRYGPELGSDARRCRAVLIDFCPRQKRDVRVLTAAVEEGIPGEIMSRGTTVPRAVLTESLARRLFEHQGIEVEIARWSVGCWMDALAGQKAGAPRPAGGAGGAGMSASGTGAPGPKVALPAARSSGLRALLVIFVVVVGLVGLSVYGVIRGVSALMNGSETASAGGAADKPRADPPRVDAGPAAAPTPPVKPADAPVVGKPVRPVDPPAPRPVDPWDDAAFGAARAAEALALVKPAREQAASRRERLARAVEGAEKGDTANLISRVSRAIERARDEDRWPVKVSGYTLTQAQAERVTTGLAAFQASQEEAVRSARGVIDRLTGVLSELSDIEKKLACAAGVSSDPSCAGLRPTRGLVEPLSARGEQARRTLAAVPADPVFPVLDVAKLAGAP